MFLELQIKAYGDSLSTSLYISETRVCQIAVRQELISVQGDGISAGESRDQYGCSCSPNGNIECLCDQDTAHNFEEEVVLYDDVLD